MDLENSSSVYGWNIDLRAVVKGEGSNKAEEVVRDKVIK